LFITFEGIEGCGKTTQAKRLVNRLRELSIPVVFTLEPGGTRVGQEIRRILLDSRNQHLSPLTELLLYVADRAQHVQEVIKPALEQEKWVLCDRFFDATTVYQGYARGQDMSLIASLNEKATLGIWPDTTFLIDCSVEIGLKRAFKRNKILLPDRQDRFEREKRDFHEAVRQGYLSMAKGDPKRFIVVDGTLREDELESVIFEYVRPFISKEMRVRGS
jgi:dTMP kinase